MDYQGGDTYGGGGGGGFSTGGDAYGAASSQGGGGGSQGGAKRNYDEQTTIPVTARMILAAQRDPADADQVRLEDDRKLYQVKLVGAIRSVETNSTNVQYQIEDGTGLAEVKQWVDDGACTALQETMAAVANKEHAYVKIIGKLKPYDGKVTLMANSVRLLTTGNELAHHFLEVVYSGEKFKNSSTIVQPTSPMMGISHNNPSSGGVGFGGGSSGRTPLMAQSGGGSGDGLRDSLLNYINKNGGTFDVAYCTVSVQHLLVFGLELTAVFSIYCIFFRFERVRSQY